MFLNFNRANHKLYTNDIYLAYHSDSNENELICLMSCIRYSPITIELVV